MEAEHKAHQLGLELLQREEAMRLDLLKAESENARLNAQVQMVCPPTQLTTTHAQKLALGHLRQRGGSPPCSSPPSLLHVNTQTEQRAGYRQLGGFRGENELRRVNAAGPGGVEEGNRPSPTAGDQTTEDCFLSPWN